MLWDKITRNLLVVLAVYAALFLFAFLPFLQKAAELNLLGDPFLWLMIVLNVLPLALAALYFTGKAGTYARLALIASAFAAAFFTVFFVLPLQL